MRRRRRTGDPHVREAIGATLRDVYPPDTHADARLEALLAKLERIPSLGEEP